MELNCDNCDQILEKYLCDMPEEWRIPIITSICESLTRADCEDVSKCETLTSLSAFSRTSDTVSFSFSDETGEIFTRSFEIPKTQTLSAVLPYCLASQEDWDNMTFLERLEALIDIRCACCD